MTHKGKCKCDEYKKCKKNMKQNDTSRCNDKSSKPFTKNWIDIEEGIKKDKEVKEKDVFDFKKSKAVKR